MAHAPNVIRATWTGEHRFDTGRPNGPVTRLDGSAHTGQSPPDALLSAVAACSGIDLVDILAKRRTPVERLSIDVEGDRREAMPRRFLRLRITYRLDGAGIEAVHAERAVALAFEKYCSVAATLASDTAVETVVVVNGVAGPAVTQALGR
ncbi:MAG: OsmC family protein [Gemmatimonadaceae bacterium]|nr:OsmC family protein [Gemmatimonadaceae bacterium]NUO94453.1 OsmC family protein [Gemmatimonadaceae bacterium]NUP55202.1 OsmC family protein [Gemmatimonadaceae bacterium]NUP71056.1 OsmC family protein [Gemmatimonadaceae bacterium]NUR33025.1 OsmC family protein [Gemmatimonadaceae bacterium]